MSVSSKPAGPGFALEHIDQAGIALHQRRGELHTGPVLRESAAVASGNQSRAENQQVNLQTPIKLSIDLTIGIIYAV